MTDAVLGTIALFTGGDGGLVRSDTLVVGGRPAAVGIGDLDHDGYPDLVIADDSDPARGLQVLLHR